MIVGTPREIKNHECRVGLTPASVRELVAAGHQVRAALQPDFRTTRTLLGRR